MSPRSKPDQSRRIGPYQIIRRLGAGGMGVVYLGQDDSGGYAAVKVLHPDTTADPARLARLQREVAAARSVPRFCTAPVLAADLTADPPYVATEYIEGPTLTEKVQGSTLAGAELEGLALGVAMALRAIHGHGMVHRDLKPSNIMLSSVGPRVIDFGIARPADGGPAGGQLPITRRGQVIGTLPYMAPEQVRGEELTTAVDVFAWAGVLAYAATGQPPFGFDEGTRERILRGEPMVPGMDKPLRQLVLAAFQKNPAARPTAADLVDELSHWRPSIADPVRRSATEPASATPPTLVDSPQPPSYEPDPPPTIVPVLGPSLAAQLKALLEAGKVMAAQRLVSELAPAQTPAECRELATRARAMAQRATELRDRAVAATDPDLAWRLLDEAEAQAADLPDLAALRRRWPPHPPGTPAAHPTEAGIVITWPPSRSHTGQVRYRTLRSVRPFRAGHADGELIAEGGECRVLDPRPPVNTPLHYAVVAQRGGVAAPPVVTGSPAWHRPEVTDVRVTSSEGVVAAAWRAPAEAARISIRRATERAPRDPSDGAPVEPTGDGYVDEGLKSGVRYHYLVTAVYLTGDGSEAHTAGVQFSAVPARSPQPVRELRLDPIQGEPDWLYAGFAAPGWGTVELRELTAPPEQPVGARLPATQLPGRPVPAVPVTGGLKLPVPARPAVLLAATISGELAAIGAYREWRPVPVPTGLRAQRRGDEILLTWQWPAGVAKAQVGWRAVISEPEPASAPLWHRHPVTAARYQVDGGATVRPYGARRYEVSVASLVPGIQQEVVGAPVTALVQMPVPGAYAVSWQGWPDRQVLAAVTARQPVRVPRLVLVAAPEWPLSPAVGHLLAEARDVTLSPHQPWLLRGPEPAGPRPYWLRCFAPDGPVELRDPPRDQLLVR